jgi:hypothetical protein
VRDLVGHAIPESDDLAVGNGQDLVAVDVIAAHIPAVADVDPVLAVELLPVDGEALG